MSYYEFLLFGHISFVAIWTGSDFAVQFFAFRARKAGAERFGSLLGDIEVLGSRVLAPASGLVVLFGALMVIDEAAWEFSQLWVALGIGLFLLSAIAGMFYLTPETGRIKTLVEQHGIAADVVQSRVRRILLISRIELILLFLVILDMVVKPGL